MNKSWCVQWTHHQSQGSEEGGCLHASSSSNHVLYTICTSTHVYKYARSKHTIITYKCICMKGNTERLGEEPINKSRKQTLVLSFSLTFFVLADKFLGQLKVMVTNCSLACHPFSRHLPDKILAKILLRSESFTEQRGSCHEQGGGAQPQLFV